MVNKLWNQFNDVFKHPRMEGFSNEDRNYLVSLVVKLITDELNNNNNQTKPLKTLLSEHYFKLLKNNDNLKNQDIIRLWKFCINNEIQLPKNENVEEMRKTQQFNQLKDAILNGKFNVLETIHTCDLNPQDPTDKCLLIEIAKLTADKNASIFFKYIKNFGLDPKKPEDREALIDIAKICTKTKSDVKRTAECIKNFGLDPKNPEEKEALIEIAKMCAKEHWETIRDIQNFGLDPKNSEERKALIEIAKICAAQNGFCVPWFIKNFGFDPKNSEERKALMEIFKTCATLQNMEQTIRKIENFNFRLDLLDPEDRKFLIEFAKICAAQKPEVLAECIQNFRFNPQDPEDRKVLIELAKICAAQSPKAIVKNIQKFRFNPRDPEDRKVLIELAKICAAQNPEVLAESIENFRSNPQDPEDRKVLIELAKICAAQSPKAIVKNIQKFRSNPQDPEDRKFLIEVAKMWVAQNAEVSAYYIINFYLDPRTPEEREILIDIAKICAAQNGGGTSQHIKNFGFDPNQDSDALIEIAKICAAQNGEETAKWIQNFGLDPTKPEDRDPLISIAKICAKKEGGRTAECIQNFGLDPTKPEERDALIDIAKICAAQEGGRTAMCIQNFGLDPTKPKDQIALIEIFKIALDQNFTTNIFYIKNYKLDFTSNELSPFLEGVLNRIFVGFANYVDLLELEDIETFLIDSNLKYYLKERYDILIAYKDNNISGMASVLNQMVSSREILKQILNFEGLNERDKVKAMTLAFYTILKFKEFDDSDIERSLPVIRDISQIQQPRLRYDLINRLHSVLADPIKKESFFKLYNSSKSSFKLPLIYCVLFEMDSEKISTVNHAVNLNLFKKDGNLKRLTLETLEGLAKLPDLTLSDKSWLMGESFKGNLRQMKSILQLIRTLIIIARGERLSQGSLESLDEVDLRNKLKKQFSNHLKSLIPISLEDQDLYEKYQKMTEQFRDPSMLLQYMQGTVRKNSELKATFVQFVDAMLNGNFQDWRYSKESNPHLKVLFQENKGVEEAWKAGLIDEIGAASQSTASQLDFKRLIEESFGDHHFDNAQFPELVKYLEDADPKTLEELKKHLKEKRMELSPGDLERLSFTLRVIGLMNAKDPSRQKNLLDNLIKQKLAVGQFEQDLKDWQSMLRPSQSSKAGEILKVVEEDDPYDLLVCGTEVLGSCQSVHGEPGLNKCLLGYIANGQNRLIAVKDPQGKIVARSLIRLLIREGKPVLFLERLYPANIKEDHKNAIYTIAQKKAQLMGLPLFEVSKVKMQIRAKIESLGGQAPYDYVDASRGIASNGKYTISDYSAVWEPIA